MGCVRRLLRQGGFSFFIGHMLACFWREKVEDESRAGLATPRSVVLRDFRKAHANLTAFSLFKKRFKDKKSSRSKETPKKFAKKQEIVPDNYGPTAGPALRLQKFL